MPGFNAEPLHEAVYLARKELVEDALDSGMATDTRSSTGLTPLMLAAQLGMEEIARVLISAGADVDATTGWNEEDGLLTPLHFAARRGWTDICRLLLEKGANPNCTSSAGETPLTEAMWHEFWPLAFVLLAHGADSNGSMSSSSTPLVIAAMHNRIDLVEELLRRGADPTRIGTGGCSSIEAARTPECFRLLQSHGADTKARNRDGATVLLTNLLCAPLELIRCYIEAGVDVNAPDNEQQIALMRLASRPDIELARILIDAGADVNANVPGGLSVLDYIAGDSSGSASDRVRRKELVDYLRSRGAKSTIGLN